LIQGLKIQRGKIQGSTVQGSNIRASFVLELHTKKLIDNYLGAHQNKVMLIIDVKGIAS
jgi:hypothetical protein